MPENVLSKWYKKVPAPWKTCFGAAFFVGLLAHLYKITNWLPNWDSLVFRYDAQNMLSLGRWFLGVVCAPSSYYDLPLLAGLLCLLFHALGAVCICRLLEVEKKTTAFLIGAYVVTFPTVTSVMMYNYVADGYALAFFLSCLAAVLMTRERPLYIPAACLITLSAGIYQAYVATTVVLVLLHLIDRTLYRRAEPAILIKKSIGCLLTGASGMILYYAVLKIILALSGTELIAYQGIKESLSLSSIDLPASFYTVCHSFLGFFFDVSQGLSPFVLLNAAFFAASAFFAIKYMIENKVFSSPVRLLLLTVWFLLLLLGSTILAFINPIVDYHNLMRMGFCVFFLFFVILYERGQDKSEKTARVKCWLVFSLAVAMIFTQTVIANVSYHKAQIAYEKSYGVLIRIAGRIEGIPDAGECDEILVIGALDDSLDYSVSLPPDITGITDGFILRFDDETVGQSVLCSALNDYCGKSYRHLSGERKLAVMQKPEIQAMETWPSTQSIAVIDHILVIKLGE